MLAPVQYCGPPPYSCNRTLQTLCNSYTPMAKIVNWASINNDENEIASTLIDKGPLSVLLDASTLSFYHKGIYNPTICNDEELNHAVLLVGFGEENGIQYWSVKNSWGKQWGEEGYFRIARGVNKCGIASGVTTSIM